MDKMGAYRPRPPPTGLHSIATLQ